ncbi:GumC family protein [Candidatus Manganitrophus noduliformans]|uniref:Polysaccharide chain length determinant N-terminal domain-containing protein n=1 Tax=Candidatus Manganitrophus noduliformans TaxID=2606439 RepID=A0A7X6DP12_9BACT|nr:Wzz/FepE/Etk N-terminal domain-containing protein [Candidatus Manganitrophus noduliformans]NKE70652.1 hypothetical protein [Candidatus Manganitrophus noduliformans]
MREQSSFSIGYLLESFHRRKHWIWLTALIISAASVAIALRMPKIYQATSMVLVQPHRFPEQIGRAFDLSRMENRLKALSEVIYSRTFLQPIIDAESLYADMAGERTPHEIIEQMRKDIRIDITANDVFGISYEGTEPEKVMNATNRIAKQFISLLQQQVAVTPVNPQIEFLEGRLKELYGEQADLQSTYTKVHPELIALKKKIAEVEAVLRAEKRAARESAVEEARAAVDAEFQSAEARIIDEATLPMKPFKPNRTLFVLIGSLIGLGAGVGLAVLAEISDRTFRYAGDLQSYVGLPVLVCIPQVETAGDLRRVRIRRRLLWGVSLILICLTLFYFYQNPVSLGRLDAATIGFQER